MNELLMMIGLIATLFVALLALAGLYALYRKRPLETAGTQMQSQSTAGNSPNESPVALESTPAEPEPNGFAINPVWAHSAFSTGQTGSPLFERLGKGPKKVETETAPSPVSSSSRYAWD